MTDRKKEPLPTGEDEDIEEALGVIWHKFEEGISDKEKIVPILKEGVNEDVYSKLAARGLIEDLGGKTILTAEGKRLARDVTRRHRLAERLLSDVLNLPNAVIDPNACRLEHIISPEIAESICTLLGHPQQCPHGSSIPEGDCCKKEVEKIDPVVVTLDKLEAGSKARIRYILLHNHPDLHKLLALGLVPGTLCHLHQTSPAYVLEVGETTIALEQDIAEKIYVRRV